MRSGSYSSNWERDQFDRYLREKKLMVLKKMSSWKNYYADQKIHLARQAVQNGDMTMASLLAIMSKREKEARLDKFRTIEL